MSCTGCDLGHKQLVAHDRQLSDERLAGKQLSGKQLSDEQQRAPTSCRGPLVAEVQISAARD